MWLLLIILLMGSVSSKKNILHQQPIQRLGNANTLPLQHANNNNNTADSMNHELSSFSLNGLMTNTATRLQELLLFYSSSSSSSSSTTIHDASFKKQQPNKNTLHSPLIKKQIVISHVSKDKIPMIASESIQNEEHNQSPSSLLSSSSLLSFQRNIENHITNNVYTIITTGNNNDTTIKKGDYDQKKKSTNAITFLTPCSLCMNKNSTHHSTTITTTTNDTLGVQESISTLLAARALSKADYFHYLSKKKHTSGNDDQNQPQNKSSINQTEYYHDNSYTKDALELIDSMLSLLDSGDESSSSIIEIPDNDHDYVFFASYSAANAPLLSKYLYYSISSSGTNDTNHTNSNDNSKKRLSENPPYIPNTRIPHWSLFCNNNNSINTVNSNCSSSTTICCKIQNKNHTDHQVFGSIRVTTLPLHASIVWEIFATTQYKIQHHQSTTFETNQDKNDILNEHYWFQLEKNYQRIYKNHEYIHEVIMRECVEQSPSSSSNNNDDNDTNTDATTFIKNNKCYNINHPWSTLEHMSSPTWEYVLTKSNIIETMKNRTYQIPFTIPDRVRNSYDFPISTEDNTNNYTNKDNDVYTAFIYLLNCISDTLQTEFVCQQNLTSWSHNNNNTDNIDIDIDISQSSTEKKKQSKYPQILCEELLLNKCHFGMLDVGTAFALAQSDKDLEKIANVLYSKYLVVSDSTGSTARKAYRKRMQLEMQISHIMRWKQQNQYVINNLLWSDRHESYLSRYVLVQNKTTTTNSTTNATSVVPSYQSYFVNLPVANNFLAYIYQPYDDDNHQEEIYNGIKIDKNIIGIDIGKENYYNNNDHNDFVIANRLRMMADQLFRRPRGSDSDNNRNKKNDDDINPAFNFDCGYYPIWSYGCGNIGNIDSDDITTNLYFGRTNLSSSNNTSIITTASDSTTFDTTRTPIINPIINYLVGLGMTHNKDVSLYGIYLTNRTMQLLNSSSTTNNNTNTTRGNYNYNEAYNAAVDYPYPLANDHCGISSVSTVSIIYNLYSLSIGIDNDLWKGYLPIIPIRSSWVYTLIVVELCISFSVGLSCLWISLNLVRNLKMENDHTITTAVGGTGSGISDSHMLIGDINDDNNNDDDDDDVYYDSFLDENS